MVAGGASGPREYACDASRRIAALLFKLPKSSAHLRALLRIGYNSLSRFE
jgi:hypothetical protein